MAYFIDQSQSGSVGAGTRSSPWSLASFISAFSGVNNSFSSNAGGAAFFFRSGAAGRISTARQASSTTSGLFGNSSGAGWGNITIGTYGGTQPAVLSGDIVYTGTWTQYQGSNAWSTPYTNADRWYYGGAATNGLLNNLQLNNPFNRFHGGSLTLVASLANCQSTPFSYYYDGSANVYVNLGGVNPNTIIMSYSGTCIGMTLTNSFGLITLRDLQINACYDGGIIIAANTSSPTLGGITVENLSGYGHCAPSSSLENDTFQFYGPNGNSSVGGPWQGCVFDTIYIAEGQGVTLDVMGMDGAKFKNINIDNCESGVTAWNNLTNSEFLQCSFTNIQPVNASSNRGQSFSGYWQHDSGGGQDGSNNNIRFTGCTFANCFLNEIQNGGGSIQLDHCTIIHGSSKNTSATARGTIALNTTQTNPCDNPQLMMTNCLVGMHYDPANSDPTQYFVNDQMSTSRSSYIGNNNTFFTYGSFQFGSTNCFFYNSANVASLSAWQTATGQDANSTLSFMGDQGLVNGVPLANGNGPVGGFVVPKFPGFSSAYYGPTGQYLTGFSPTPYRDNNSGALASTIVGQALSNNALASGAPSTAPSTTTSADASSTWTTGTWQITITYLTYAGETLQSAATGQAVVSGTSVPKVNIPSSPPSSALFYNVYAQAPGGGDFLLQNGAPVAIGSAWTAGHSPVVQQGSGSTKFPLAIIPPSTGLYPLSAPPMDFFGNPFLGNGADIGSVQTAP